MLDEKQLDLIKSQLFSDEDTGVYAIIDGASCPELRYKLYDWEPQSTCLWSGELEPDVEEVAPFMVKIERNHTFTDWLLNNSWDKHWNIFISSDLDFKTLRKEVRKLQLVRSPEGKTLLFRFYDPRVIDIFLPTCSAEQLQELYAGFSRIQYFKQDLLKSARIDTDGALSVHDNTFSSEEIA